MIDCQLTLRTGHQFFHVLKFRSMIQSPQMAFSNSAASQNRSAKSVNRAARHSIAWSFAGTLDLDIHNASQGIGSRSGGIVNSTEICTKLFRDRDDNREASLKSIGNSELVISCRRVGLLAISQD